MPNNQIMSRFYGLKSSDSTFNFDDECLIKAQNKSKKKGLQVGLRVINDTYIVENIVQDAFLKLWEFRRIITSLEHAEAFIIQNVKWGCSSYFRSRGPRFYREMVKLDALESYDKITLPTALLNDSEEDSEDDLYEQRLQSAWNAISHIFSTSSYAHTTVTSN